MEEVLQYFNKKQKLHRILLTFLEDIFSDEADLQNLIKFIQANDILNDYEEFEHFLRLLLGITSNHHMTPGFFHKIERIFLSILDEIKQTFSNQELFKIFSCNKKIFYFLLDKEVIVYDDIINEYAITSDDPAALKYCHFFYKENPDQISSENCLQKLQIGENDSYLCSLIRQDSIKEFVQYVNQTHLDIKNKIKPSLFETNSLLIEKEATLIEYAAFFGSIKIFLYLKKNYEQLDPDVMIYAIHSQNVDLIHIIEGETNNWPPHLCMECYKEAIKCHHNEIADYFKINYLLDQVNDKEIIELCLKCSNYLMLPEKFEEKPIFYDLYDNKYIKLVDLLTDSKSEKAKAIEKIVNQKIYIVPN